jgi:hypothetical protein
METAIKPWLARVRRLKRRAEQIAYDLEQLEDDMAKGTEIDPREFDGIGVPVREKNLLIRMAVQGASSLEIRRQPDESADVRIDGRKGFRVTPAVADLLEILSATCATQEAGDALVGWKSYDTVLQLLAKKSGKRKSTHAIAQLVFRLKQHLRRADENPFLVQVNRRRKAMRFAVRVERPPELKSQESDH